MASVLPLTLWEGLPWTFLDVRGRIIWALSIGAGGCMQPREIIGLTEHSTGKLCVHSIALCREDTEYEVQ